MGKIIFVTSGKIDYLLPGFDLYDSIRLAGLGEKFPHLQPKAKAETFEFAKKLKKPGNILSASTFQASETANLIAKKFNLKTLECSDLFPLRFDIGKLMGREEFYSLGEKAFDELRRRFLEAFFKDLLIDHKVEVKKKFEGLSQQVPKYRSYTLAVSHAFLIKLFQVYSCIGEEMFTNKKKLFKLFDPSKPPFGRLETLEINF